MNIHKPLFVSLLGSPFVTWHGETWPIARRQNRALFYVLTVEGKPVTREWLCFLFWPDTPERHARRKLTDAISQLRSTLPDLPLIQANLDTVGLNRSLIGCDIDAFPSFGSELLAPKMTAQEMTTPKLEAAITLYRGPLLQDFSICNKPEFEAWLSHQRQRWESRYLATLTLLVEQKKIACHHEQAIDYAQRHLQVDPLAENMHHTLIALYAQTGNRAAAIRQYQTCASTLASELSIEPMESTKALYQVILDGTVIPPVLHESSITSRKSIIDGA